MRVIFIGIGDDTYEEIAGDVFRWFSQEDRLVTMSTVGKDSTSMKVEYGEKGDLDIPIIVMVAKSLKGSSKPTIRTTHNTLVYNISEHTLPVDTTFLALSVLNTYDMYVRVKPKESLLTRLNRFLNEGLNFNKDERLEGLHNEH